MTTNGNGNKPWGQIRMVTEDEVPPKRHTQWFELYEELCLRLEQTPKGWLTIPFDDVKAKERAYASLRRYFINRKGEDAVEMRSKAKDEKVILYVRRGENWQK